MITVDIAEGLTTEELRVIFDELTEITKNNPHRTSPSRRGMVFSRTVNPLRLESLRVRDVN